MLKTFKQHRLKKSTQHRETIPMLRIDQPLVTPEQHLEIVLNNRRIEFVSRFQITPCMPATIRILVVADTSITFGKGAFGLQKVIDTLREPIYDFARFTIQLAHRQQGTSGNGDSTNLPTTILDSIKR